MDIAIIQILLNVIQKFTTTPCMYHLEGFLKECLASTQIFLSFLLQASRQYKRDYWVDLFRSTNNLYSYNLLAAKQKFTIFCHKTSREAHVAWMALQNFHFPTLKSNQKMDMAHELYKFGELNFSQQSNNLINSKLICRNF